MNETRAVAVCLPDDDTGNTFDLDEPRFVTIRFAADGHVANEPAVSPPDKLIAQGLARDCRSMALRRHAHPRGQ